MSKAVLISIRPEWCEKIASGQKTIEIRKTRPKIETPFKCYLYCTKPSTTDPLEYLEIHTDDKIHKANGKVIGEFVCDDLIIDFKGENADIFENQGCIALAEQKKYGGNKPLYGWHISDLVIYEKPKELSDFCTDSSVFTFDDEGNQVYTGMKRPPQSWCYVEKQT